MRTLLTVLLMLWATVAWGHTGSVDSYGCHNNTTKAVYECHAGQFAGKSWPNPGGKTAMLAAIAAIPTTPPPPSPVMVGATLTWDAPTDTVTKGYFLYWGLASRQYEKPIDIGMRTSLELTSLLRGATWYFALKAYDAQGNTSPFSNEAFKEVP